MKRPKDYIIPPHVHNAVAREVQFTQEVLYIKSGKVRVDFYDDDRNYLQSSVLEKGDVILLAYGGHGFEMIEESEMIEIKQGHILGGFQSDLDVANCVKAIDLCMKFVFTELSQYYKVDIKNEYKAEELHLISGGLSVSSDGKIVPDITSKGSIGSDGANAIALLEMIKNPEKFFGKK